MVLEAVTVAVFVAVVTDVAVTVGQVEEGCSGAEHTTLSVFEHHSAGGMEFLKWHRPSASVNCAVEQCGSMAQACKQPWRLPVYVSAYSRPGRS